MQERKENLLESSELRCQQNNECETICFNKNCRQLAFMCSQINCSCTKKHNNCKIQNAKDLLIGIENSRIELDQKLNKVLQHTVQRIDELITRLSVQRQYLKNTMQMNGLGVQTREFIQNIRMGQRQKCSGQLIQKIKVQLEMNIHFAFNVCQSENIYKSIQTISSALDEIKMKKWQFPTIVSKEQFKGILNYMDQKSIKNIIFLFRASEHNYSSQKFHKICDKKNNTLVIVKSENGDIFGGFNRDVWRSSGSRCFSEQSFVFQLNGLKIPAKFLCNALSLGPYFQDNLQICDGCNISKQNCFHHCKLNKKNFRITDYQVFQIQFEQK